MPKESEKPTISAFTGTGWVRVIDDATGTPLSRNMAVANLANEVGGSFDPAGAAAAAQAASQPLDSDLTSIAALTTTSYGRALLELANQAALQTAVNVEDGATADQSAAEILTAIKTVDGAASGLDADLLDGVEAAGFATSGHNHAATYDALGAAAAAQAASQPTYQGDIWTPGGGGSWVGGSGYQSTNAVPVQEKLRVFPMIWWWGGSIDRMACRVTTASGVTGALFRMGIYDSNGDLVVDAGAVDVDSTGVKTVTGLNVAMAPGIYWVGGSLQGTATSAVRMYGTGTGGVGAGYCGSEVPRYEFLSTGGPLDLGTVAGALPASGQAGTTTVSGDAIHVICRRKA